MAETARFDDTNNTHIWPGRCGGWSLPVIAIGALFLPDGGWWNIMETGLLAGTLIRSATDGPEIPVS